MALQKVIKEQQLVDKLKQKYLSAMQRGHEDYQREAKYCEDMYLGAGRQWTAKEDDRRVQQELIEAGKPTLELNLIQSSVRTILGYQTQSRMNIAYQPREYGDFKVAEVLTKIALYELDRNKFPWLESQVFEDGLIQGRGYFDLRISYEKDPNGQIEITTLDPLDVIPDPDAKSYNPKDWNYVMITKWVPLEQLKIEFPKKYRKLYTSMLANENDWGSQSEGQERNKFASPYTNDFYFDGGKDEYYVRILETQHIKVVRRNYFYNPETQESYPAPDNMTIKQVEKQAKNLDLMVNTRTERRVRHTITTADCLLYDDWSPYDQFTVVPYFPIFRRGITIGLVENLISNQEMMNKVYSQILHIVNTTANSGWQVEQGSLTNMDIEDLEQEGASTGLVIEYGRGRTPPQKIEPNQIPTGLKDIFNTSRELHDQILGVNEAFRGERTNEVSGQAIQQRVSQTGVGLTSIIDNLFFTRNLVAEIILNYIQTFYTEARTFRIMSDSRMEEQSEEVQINQEIEDIDPETQEAVTSIINDVTVGKYDIVISDVPTQVTYLDAQFQQGLEMRKFGIQVPDDEMILMSTLTRRNEIAKKVSGEANEAQQQQMQIQIEQLQAENEKLKQEAESKQKDALKKAAEVAKMISEDPTVAPILEQVLGMVGTPQDIQQTPQQPQVQENMPQQPQLGNFF